MRIRKRILAALTAAAMLSACCVPQAFAANTAADADVNLQIAETTETASGTCGGDLTWVLYDDGTLEISGTGKMTDYDYGTTPWYDYHGSITNVVINDGVTSIGKCAFYECYYLISIIIPEGVTSIGNDAFSNSGLGSITFPDSLTSIGNSAFEWCGSLTSIILPDGLTSIGYRTFFGCDELTSVVLPEGLISIDSEAFGQCSSLMDIIIPEGVTSIGDAAFNHCTALTSVTLPESLISIGTASFGNCTSLSSITIPANVESIGNSPIYGSGSLMIDVDENNTYFSSADGVLFNKNQTEILLYAKDKIEPEYIIPDGVTRIGDFAFDRCTALTSVTIPESVTSIGNYAFDYCTGLTEITIPENVDSIGSNAFCHCSKLTEIAIPEGIESVAYETFGYCSGLTSITIPKNVTSIGDYAFNYCTSLTDIIIPDGVESIGYKAFYNCTALTDVYYTGTEDEWNAIIIGDNNDPLTTATITCLGTAEEETTTPTDEPTEEPSEAPTEEPVEEATPVPTGTVLYSQDYDDATEVDWVSPNYQDMFSLVADADGGQMLQADHSVSSPNSRGAYLLFGDLEAGSQYVLEFDMGLEEGSNHNQDSQFAVMGADYNYTINDGINSGYALKLTAAAGASAITIEDSDDTVPYDGTMYHYSVIVDGIVAYLTVTDGDDVIVEQQTLSVNGDGGLAGLYYRSGRNTGIMQIDNIVLRTPYDGEVPENTTHTVTVNTMRYATMELADGTVYYADVDGLIYIPLVEDGTVFDYTISKVGYTSVTGSETIDGDKIFDIELAADEAYAGYVYYESDFGNADGAYISSSGSRADSIDLGSITIPEISNISVDLSFEGFGSNAGQQKTWAIVTDAGKLVGLQITDDGMTAWTGWSGNSNMNQYSDIGAYTNSAVLAEEYPTGDFSVEFAINTVSNTITATYGDVSATLDYDIEPTEITGLATGLYRYNGEMYTYKFAVTDYSPVASGTCGDDLTWELYESGTLKISGTGDMEDYTYVYGMPWYSYLASITRVVIGDGVTSIGDYAFYDCTNMISITIPDSVINIGNCVFYGCSGLISVTIPDSVTSIGECAFSGCSGLTSITIPEGVTSISNDTFAECTGLESITIPDSVTSIGGYAFCNCTSLKDITIPDSVTSIGEWAFDTCESITDIVIPDGVTSIDEYTFARCASLANITIPDTVTSIGNRAFLKCTSLARISIPVSVTNIDSYAFYDCSSLASVYYTGTEDEWNAITIGSDNDPLTSAAITYNYTEILPGTILYSQDYDDATEVDWVSPNYQDMFSLVADANGGQMLQADHSVSSTNSRGAYLLFGDLAAGSQYVLDFDMGLEAGDNHNQDSQFAVMGADYNYTINDGINSGYALKLTAATGASTITIEDLDDTIPYDGVMYHYSVIVDGTIAYLTVTDGDDIVVEQQVIPVNGDGGLAGFYYRSGRNTGIMQIDNIVLRTPYEDEIPENTSYTVTVNTTRYATMELSDGTTYYADVNGTIDMPLIETGTEFDYTISKVGYTSVTGTATVDGANLTIDAPLTLDDNHADYIYFESDFGNADGAYVSAAGSRNDSINLGSIELPELSTISVDLSFDGFGTYSGLQKSWAIITDAGKLVGLQMTDDGMVAWTGWTGSSAMNQSGDTGAYTNSVTLAEEYPTGDFSVEFVVDTNSKSITVLYNGVSTSLSYDIDATEITGLATGLYRYYGAMNTYEISVTEPDAAYMFLSGDTSFAKVSGQTVTREYTKTEAVITPDETFEWTVSPEADGISVADGVVYVTDEAEAGEYVITATGSTGKTASITITVGDFSLVMAEADGPISYTIGQTGTYAVTSLVDEYEDDVIDLFTPTFTSSDESVITIDENGAAKAVGNGSAVIKVTIGNPGIETVVGIPVTVKDYYITADTTGDTTTIDVSSILDEGEGSYVVTTASDGVLISQTTVTTDDFEDYEGIRTIYIADTTGADEVEIAPVYETFIGATVEVPADRYNITATVNNGRRTDLYVNDQLLINNINQGSDSWTVGRTIPDTAQYEANDVIIAEGYAYFNLQDDQSSGSTVTGISFVKAPSIVDRAQRVYVIGDSLVAKYYGDAPEGSEGLVRTGWGDVIANYLADDVEVTNLGNSGAWATNMLAAAFTNVAASAQAGDIVIWESGYNDRSYSTVEEMKAAITEAANICADMGVGFYVVTPNASRHDYSSSVVWSTYIRELAEEEDMNLIDLSAESYEFLSGLYGEDAAAANDILITYYNNSGDTLHSTYNAANLWAAIVAQGLYDAGETYIVNPAYAYTFSDGIQDITAQVSGETTERPDTETTVKTLTGIIVSSLPDNTSIERDAELDDTGLTVKALYDDGSSKVVTGYTLTYDTSAVGTQTVTVTYEGFTAEFDIEVLYTVIVGDINEDSRIDGIDIALLVQFILEKIEFTDTQAEAADTDGDGEVNAFDASHLVQFVLENISTL